MSELYKYSRQIVLREVGVNGRAGDVANVQWTFAPARARPGTAGPEPGTMDGVSAAR